MVECYCHSINYIAGVTNCEKPFNSKTAAFAHMAKKWSAQHRTTSMRDGMSMQNVLKNVDQFYMDMVDERLEQLI